MEDATWRNAISSITVGGSTLPSAAYSITSAGKITFTPSQSALLQSAGSKAIVVKASGYSDASVTQAIGAGAATQMAVTTQPTAPSFNGGPLATQPVVTLRDQYGNTSASTANVTVTQGGGGSWALGGTLTVGAVNGVATFTDLTAGHTAALTGATLSFSSGSLDPVSSNSFNIPAPVAPALTAAPDATVDAPFTITFTDNPAWRVAVTAVRVGSTDLASSDYAFSAGQLTLTPSASTLLQTSGAKSIVVRATGYADATVTQNVAAGTATKLVIGTALAAPATNGGLLATQPVIRFQDQYNNLTSTGTSSVTASAVEGTWTLGGTSTVSIIDGAATFTDLTAGAATALSGVTISFTSGSLTSVASSGFNIPAPVAPALTAAGSATVDADFLVTYPSNANWQNVVTGVTVGGQALDASAFFVADGQITFKPSASALLQSSGNKSIAVSATGYSDATVTQTVGAGVATKLAITTQPTAPATNGGVLATQPVVRFQDQYGNNTTGTADVTATVGNGGTWTLGGTVTVTPASNIATFVGLTAGNSGAALAGATLEFTATGLQSVVSSGFDIPPPPPANDLADNAATLPLDGTAVSGTMVQATVSAPFAGATGASLNVPDVWYKFTPSQNGAIFIQANTSSSTLDLFAWVDSVPSVTTGSLTPAGGSAVASTTVKKTTIFVEANKTYYLRVALNSAANTAQAFTLTATPNYSPRLVAWDLTGEGTVSTVNTADADVIDTNLDSSPTLTRGGGAGWSTGGNSFRTQGFGTNGISTANTDFFQFQVSASSGRRLSLQNIVVKVTGTGSFMNSPGVEMQFAYSLDGTTFNLIGSSVTTMDTGVPAFDLSGISALQNVPAATTVTLRYYASGQTTTGGWGFNSPAVGQYGLYVTGTTAAMIPPTDIALDDNLVTENAGSNAEVGILSATDSDAGDIHAFALVSGVGGEDNGFFNISGTSLRATNPLNFEGKSSYSVLVQATDSSGLTFTKAFTVSVTNANEAPSVTSDGTANVAENSTAVQTVTGSDPDAGATLTYSITGGADALLFAIDGSSGALTFVSAPDFENPGDAGTDNVYNVTVQVSDGSLTATKDVAVTVTDVNESPADASYSGWLGTNSPSTDLLLQYAYGAASATSPVARASLPAASLSNNELSLTYYVRKNATNPDLVAPQWHTNLALSNSWSTVASSNISPVGTNTVNGVEVIQMKATVPVDGARKFLRLKIAE